MKRRTIALTGTGAITIGLLAACGTSVTPTSTPSNAAPAAAAQSAAPSPSPSSSGPVSGGIGSSFKVTDSQGDVYDVTLDKVIDPAQGADQFSTPDNGKRFVAAVFTIRGVSGTSSDDANSDAVVTGSDTQQYQPDFDDIAGYTNFNSGEFDVTPSQTLTGAVNFQVPTGVTVANVQWVANSFSGAVGTWDLK